MNINSKNIIYNKLIITISVFRFALNQYKINDLVVVVFAKL